MEFERKNIEKKTVAGIRMQFKYCCWRKFSIEWIKPSNKLAHG